MKYRPLASSGVILCTCLAPSPLVQQKEPAQLVLVVDPPKYPIPDEIEKFQFSNDMSPYDEVSFLSIKSVAWFFRNNISLCTVPTVPYEHGFVHKPPWDVN
jgi:hypothetical protein